jgi:PAS domain S-box-containing protein
MERGKQETLTHYNYRTPDGRDTLLIIKIHPFELNGRPACLVCAENVRELDRLETELTRKCRICDGLFDGVHDGIAVLDRSGKVVEVNAALLTALDRERDEVIGSEGLELIAVEEKEVLGDFLQRALAGSEPLRTGMCQARKAGGGNVFVDIGFVSLAASDGSSEGVILCARFITDTEGLEPQVGEYTRSLGYLVKERTRELERKGIQTERMAERYGEDPHMGGVERILGHFDAIKALRKSVVDHADSNSAVLISGETGAGKDLVATSLHYESRRKNRPFKRLLCSAVPPQLFESEIFGHERGSFTDAHKSRKGIIEAGGSGTVFLDEIGEMPVSVQAKMLLVLEAGIYMRIGGEGKVMQTGARFVAATNVDVMKALESGKLREDLFFRLNHTWLQVPPLRERGDDILLLAEHFIEMKSRELGKPPIRLSRESNDLLLGYRWPGNVRELRSIMDRVVIHGSEEVILRDAVLTDEFGRSAPSAITRGLKRATADEVAAFETKQILEALKRFGWNRRKAAAYLKISYRSLMLKMKKYDLRRGGRPA